MDRKNQIITDIHNSGLLVELCTNMGVKANDIDDLIQEIYLIIAEYDEDRIVEMWEKSQLKFFLVRVISNQYFSKNSPFYKKYKKYYRLIDGNIANNETENEEYTGLDD